MRVRLLCGAHVVWDCLFNTGYPGFGVLVPLFIGYLISNLILLKTNETKQATVKNDQEFYQLILIHHYIYKITTNKMNHITHDYTSYGVIFFEIVTKNSTKLY